MTRTLTLFVLALTLVGPVTGATVDQAIVEKMALMYGLDPGCYQVEILSNPLKSAAVTADDITIHPLTSKEPLGLFTAIVKVRSGGEIVESGQVRMKIRRFADVVVVTGKIGSRQQLDTDRLSLRRMDVTSLTEQPLTSAEQTRGYRAKRNLRKGTILTLAAIEPTPDVETGKQLTIVYVDGLCRVTAAGVAMESGLAGDYIKVKNKQSGKMLYARVVDANAVAVDP